MVTDVDVDGLVVRTKDGAESRIESQCKVWSAGVQASPLGKQLGDAYWIAEPDDIIAKNLIQFKAAEDTSLDVHTEYYAARGATLVTVIAADHPGLFYRIAGGIHLAG